MLLPVGQVADPSQQEIDNLHAEYVAALVSLYNENKEKYGEPGMKLVIT